MRLFQAALDTPLDSPFSATLSVHGLHFTVCALSKFHSALFLRFFCGTCGESCDFELRVETQRLRLRFFGTLSPKNLLWFLNLRKFNFFYFLRLFLKPLRQDIVE